MGVVVLSLVLASVGLPLLRGKAPPPVDPSIEIEEAAARIVAAHAAIAEIERLQVLRSQNRPDADIVVAAAAQAMKSYRSRLESRSGDAAAHAQVERGRIIARDPRIAAIAAERSAILGEVRRQRLGSATRASCFESSI